MINVTDETKELVDSALTGDIKSLKDGQLEAIHIMLTNTTKGCLNASEMGTGKTFMSALYAKIKQFNTVLIIAPKDTFLQWMKAFHNQADYDTPFFMVDGTINGVASAEQLRSGVRGVYVVGREFFATSGKFTKAVKDEAGEIIKPAKPRKIDWRRITPELVIFDEVHRGSNKKSVTASVLKTAFSDSMKIGLSGTPQGNKFHGIWPVTRWLWPHDINPETKKLYVDTSSIRWAEEFCHMEPNRYAFSGKKSTGEELEKGKFVSTLPAYFRLESDQPPIEEIHHKVVLTPYQYEQYKSVEDKLLLWIEENKETNSVDKILTMPNVLVKQIRLHQIALGEVDLKELESLEDEESILDATKFELTYQPNCKSPKLDKLQELINTPIAQGGLKNENLLILTHSAKFAKVVADRLPKAMFWGGGVSNQQRAEIKAQFGKSVKYIVAQVQSIAEGVDGLQDYANHIVELSPLVGNATLMSQAYARLRRSGQENQVYLHRILAEDTEDYGVVSKLIEIEQNQRHDLKDSKMAISLSKVLENSTVTDSTPTKIKNAIIQEKLKALHKNVPATEPEQEPEPTPELEQVEPEPAPEPQKVIGKSKLKPKTKAELVTDYISGFVTEFTQNILKQGTDRDKQRKVGASNISNPCDYCLGHDFLGTKEQSKDFYLRTKIGTGVHLFMEEQIKNITSDKFVLYPEERVKIGEIAGYGEFMNSTDDINSTSDLFYQDSGRGLVIDWKTTTREKLTELKKASKLSLDETSDDKKAYAQYSLKKYLYQCHLYGLGMENAGHKVDYVGASFICIDGFTDDDIWAFMVPYDREKAELALERAQDIFTYLVSGGTVDELDSSPLCYSCRKIGRTQGEK